MEKYIKIVGSGNVNLDGHLISLSNILFVESSGDFTETLIHYRDGSSSSSIKLVHSAGDYPSSAVRTSGAATSNAADKIVSSTGDFVNEGVQVGDIILNTTDNKRGYVDVVNSATVLSLKLISTTGGSGTLFTGTQDYVILKDESIFNFGSMVKETNRIIDKAAGTRWSHNIWEFTPTVTLSNIAQF